MLDTFLSFPKESSIFLLSEFLQVGLQICQPSLIQELTTFLKSPTAPMNVGYGLLGGFFCVTMLNAVIATLSILNIRSHADDAGESCLYLCHFTTQVVS